MTREHDLEGMDSELAAFVASVRADQACVVNEEPARPDFLEVVARAHAIDSVQVPASRIEEAHKLASVIPLYASSVSQELAPDAEFSDFLADVRAEGIRGSAQHLAGARGETPAVEAPVKIASDRRRARLTTGLVALAAAAAIVLLFASGAGVRLLQSSENDTPNAARHDDQVQIHQHSVESRPARVSKLSPKAVAPLEPELPEPESEQVDTDPEVADPEQPSMKSPAQLSTTKPARAAKPRQKRDPLAELDAQAQAKWRAGDLAGAENLLRKVIKKGRRGRRVQLAYGDLFTLVRQIHAGTSEEQLWREYLRTFPRGPHADDARAGLCRRAADADATSCWRDYLEHHPRGAHRRQAQKVVEQPTGVGENP